MNEILKARIREQQLERELEEQRKHEQKDDIGEAEQDSNSSDDEDEYAAMQRRVAEAGTKLSLNPAHKGTQLLFMGIQMSGIGVLKAKELLLQLMCVRCSTKNDITIEPGRSNQISCKHCHTEIHIKYRPEMLHEHSTSLGYFDLVNAEAFDLLPCSFWATCIECFHEAAFESLARGIHYELNCYVCHQKLTLYVENIQMNCITGAATTSDSALSTATGSSKVYYDPAAAAAKKNARREQALLKVGTPLPNKGKHKFYCGYQYIVT